MNAKETSERIAVMQAYAEGKIIEVQIKGEHWWSEAPSPDWAWDRRTYRVKNTPRTFWLVVSISGTVKSACPNPDEARMCTTSVHDTIVKVQEVLE